MSVTVIDYETQEERVEQLRCYLKELGAEISEDISQRGLEDDLHKIIGVCDTCFKEDQEADIEMTLNTIVGLLIVMQLDISENLILAFCEKLNKAQNDEQLLVSLRVLSYLFHGLSEQSPVRYHVYYNMVQVAGRTDQINSVFESLDKLKAQFHHCPPNTEQMQKLLRLLHELLLKSKESELATKVMIELLGTYTEENASQAREDAQRCIIASLSYPNIFLMDHLLTLKPVRFLEGELIHDLLSIFVFERLNSYVQFYQNHKEFVNSLGLNHDQLLKKMKLLSFMQLAETKSEIDFDQIQQELQLEEKEVECFVIEVLKTKLVRARMDQHLKKVFISSTMHRTFGRPQWQQLYDTLLTWRNNVNLVKDTLNPVVSTQKELILQESKAK